MILIGRGLDLAQVLKKEINWKKRTVSRRIIPCAVVRVRKSREKREAEQASEAKQRREPKRQNAAIAAPNKFTISGGYDERVTPVPIPNTEVKPLSADGTWLDTARESRSLPDST